MSTRVTREMVAALFGVEDLEDVSAKKGSRALGPLSVAEAVAAAPGDPLPSPGDLGEPEWAAEGYPGHYDDGSLRGYDLRVQVMGLEPRVRYMRRPDPASGWWVEAPRPEGPPVQAFVWGPGARRQPDPPECPCGCGFTRVECHWCRRPAGAVESVSKGGYKYRWGCTGGPLGPGVAAGHCADGRAREGIDDPYDDARF